MECLVVSAWISPCMLWCPFAVKNMSARLIYGQWLWQKELNLLLRRGRLKSRQQISQHNVYVSRKIPPRCFELRAVEVRVSAGRANTETGQFDPRPLQSESRNIFGHDAAPLIACFKKKKRIVPVWKPFCQVKCFSLVKTFYKGAVVCTWLRSDVNVAP